MNAILPAKAMFPLALQHVLTMYSGALAVPLVLGAAVGLTREQIAFLISADLLTCGIATLFQTLGIGARIGIRLPLMMGVTMIAVAPMISIGRQLGMCHLFGAILVSGLVMFCGAGILGRLVRFFPPVVTGSIMLTVGMKLVPVAVQWVVGDPTIQAYGRAMALGLAGGVLALIVVVMAASRGFLASIVILVGLAAGSTAAGLLGRVDLSLVTREPWLALPRPFWFGWPQFDFTAIFSMILVSLICVVESTGVFYAMGKMTGLPITAQSVARGLRAESLAAMVGSLLNSFPYITFGQNLGLVAVSKVRSRYVVALAGLMLIVMGFFPKLAALIAAIPRPVLGGATVVLFGMVGVAGLRILSLVDWESVRNQFIVATAVALGIGAPLAEPLFRAFPLPVRMLVSNGLIVCCMAGIFLNLVLNGVPRRGPEHGADGTPGPHPDQA